MKQSERISKETDFLKLMEILSLPRPNGSQALKKTRKKLSAWLDEHNICHQVQTFKLYPYFLEIGGIWLLLTQVLLVYSIWKQWGWVSIVISLVSLLVSILETRGTPILSQLISDVGENIVIEFEPAKEVRQELILSAHYDSKTELLSERWANFFMAKLPIGMLLSIVLGLFGVVGWFMPDSAEAGSSLIYYTSLVLTVPLLLIFTPIGINFIFGQWGKPSEGAIDNGAATAILMDVASRIANAHSTNYTKLTIVVFCGEETVVQGSRAYVRQRDFPYSTYALNLELMGQNGDYVIWEKIGDPFGSFPTDHNLNRTLELLVEEHNDSKLVFHSGPVGTDTLPFIQAGIPSTSFASLDTKLGFSGLHRPIDNFDRVAFHKLTNTSRILMTLLDQTDKDKSM